MKKVELSKEQQKAFKEVRNLMIETYRAIVENPSKFKDKLYNDYLEQGFFNDDYLYKEIVYHLSFQYDLYSLPFTEINKFTVLLIRDIRAILYKVKK